MGRAVRRPIMDSSLLRVQYWRFRGYFQIVGLADGPLGACGRSAWSNAELISPLLFEFRFRFGIVRGLLLWLVSPL
jgi:hypothetical protein